MKYYEICADEKLKNKKTFVIPENWTSHENPSKSLLGICCLSDFIRLTLDCRIWQFSAVVSPPKNQIIKTHTNTHTLTNKMIHDFCAPLEKGVMWSYWKQRQPRQPQNLLQTIFPATSFRHRSGWRPGTTSAFCQHASLTLDPNRRGLSFSFSRSSGIEVAITRTGRSETGTQPLREVAWWVMCRWSEYQTNLYQILVYFDHIDPDNVLIDQN